MIDILFWTAMAALGIASFTDLKKREVPDWLNYSLLAVALGVRAVYSVMFNDWHTIVYGIAGAAAGYAIAWVLFQTGQWGGGDAKLLIALGSVIGVEWAWPTLFLLFFVILLLAGSVYAFGWSIFLAATHWYEFRKEFKNLLKEKNINRARLAAIFLCIALLLATFATDDNLLKLALFTLALIIYLGFYLWLSVKSIELSCMQKLVSPEQLTEGDWIVKEIKISGKYICGPKDLGIEKHQIKKLIELKKKGKIKKILIKEGIPFVPSFLLAFIIFYFLPIILDLLNLT